MKKYGYFLGLIVGVLMTTSCSESLTCLQCISSPLLTITAPQTYFAHPSVPDMPVIVKNNSDQTISGISYSYSVNDAKLTVNSIPNTCTNIPAHGSCQMNIPLGTEATSGSVQIIAHATNASFTSNIINLVPINDNNADGADAVVLYGDDVLIASDKTTTDTIISAVVGSQVGAKGSFNKIVLADANGHQIPYCTQISGAVNSFNAGSILTFLCQIPHDINYVEVAPQLQMVSSDIQTSTSKTLGVASVSQIIDTGKVQIMLEILSATNPSSYMVQSPTIVSLNQSVQNKQITITNKGNQEDRISQIKLATNYVKIDNDNCTGKLLAPQAVCTYNLTFDPSQPFVGTDDVHVIVSSTSQPVRSNVLVNYTGNSPIINIAMLPNDVEFITNELSAIHKHTITITNNSIIAIQPQLPDVSTLGGGYFSIVEPSAGNYCFNGSSIESSQSCSFDLVYNNANNEISNSFALVIPFGYSYNGKSEVYDSVIDVSFITNNFAGLDIYDNNGDPIQVSSFETIHNNNHESSLFVVKLYNHGTSVASGISVLVDKSKNDLFSILDSNCQNSLPAGNTCQMTLAFGPTNVVANSYDSKLSIGYNSLTSPQQTSLRLNGTVLELLSANLQGFVTDSTFTGVGTIDDAYRVEQGSIIPQLTYTFTNIGNSIAESVAVDLASDSGWAIVQDDCSSKQINMNGTCQVHLALQDVSVIGSRNLDLSKLVISWSDQNQPSGITDEQSGVIYTTVVEKPKISVVLEKSSGLQSTTESQPSNLVLANTSYTFDFTMTGGVTSHTVTGKVIANSGNASLSDGGKCTLSPSKPTCQITLTTANNQVGNGDFDVNFNSDVTVNQSSIKFHTWSGMLPSTTIFNASKSLTAHNGFLYNAAPSDIYRCSVLTNGNVYACLPIGNGYNGNETYGDAQQIMFVDDVLLFSGLTNAASPYTAEWLDNISLDANGLVIRRGAAHLSVLLKEKGSNDDSGITSYAVYKDTMYFTQFNQVGLWECPLKKYLYNNQPVVTADFTSCKLSTASGSNFQGNAASLVIGNNLYVTQTVSRAQHGLNKCTINADGSVNSCNNISPIISGDAQSYDGVQYANGLLFVGGYLYGSQGISGGSDVCPFDGNNIIGSCYFGQDPQSNIITMTELNGWIYYTKSSSSSKANQLSNGKFTNVGSIIGY